MSVMAISHILKLHSITGTWKSNYRKKSRTISWKVSSPPLSPNSVSRISSESRDMRRLEEKTSVQLLSNFKNRWKAFFFKENTYKLTISALAVWTATSKGVLPWLSAKFWSALLFNSRPTWAGSPSSVASNKAVLPASSLTLIFAPLSNRYCNEFTDPCITIAGWIIGLLMETKVNSHSELPSGRGLVYIHFRPGCYDQHSKPKLGRSTGLVLFLIPLIVANSLGQLADLFVNN